MVYNKKYLLHDAIGDKLYHQCLFIDSDLKEIAFCLISVEMIINMITSKSSL